ncbi:MAG: glycosyl hydrolase [Gemmatimonadetes bacterium]|nr:MAG: glycosyl hydrolase [Gemmatimonadota bacterium]
MLAVIASVLLLVPTARTQQTDTTLWAHLRYRFVGPEGNRAVAVAGEPGNPLVAYVGAASGGIWKTEDGGVHWRAVFDSQPAQAIGAIAMAPSAHNVLWAGTGETFFIRSTTALGNGVYRSTDAGRSWQRSGLDSTGRIARVVIHPANPDVVLVCALGRAYGPQPQRGVYRTVDGGRTWTRVLFVDPHTGCSDLAIDPGDPNTLFAGMWQFEVKTWHLQSGGPGSGLWVSRDGGATWKRLTGHGLPDASHVVGKIAVAVAPSNPNTVYALIEDQDPTLYRSDDRGATWRVVSRDHTMAERAPYYVRFAVAPDDEERLYFVSVRFSMSRDGGRTLARSGYEGGGDNHDIWIDPLNPDRFMVAHDGGASITLNRGRTFMRIVLPIAQMYHVYADTRAPYYVYGNRQDGSSYRMPSRSLADGISEGAWQHVGGCESGFGIPDTVDNATVWSGCYDGGLEVYDARTGNARNVRVWPEAGYGWRPADLKYRWNWTFPIMISPHDHRRVYVGSQYLHVTTDGGASWKVVSPDLTRNDTSHQQSSGGVTTDNLMTFDGATLFALAESPVHAGVIWAGSNDGLVHVTRDGGTTWTDLTGNVPKLAPWGKISNIEPSRFDVGTAYISVDVHELDDLDPYIFKTADFGGSWKRISEGLPRSPLGFVHVVREDPARRGMLFAGTESGVYVTFDDGGHWAPLQTNLPHAPISWITVQPHFHDLVVATYGRGIWILDDISPLEAPDFPALTGGAMLFKPRPAYRFRSQQGIASAPNSAVRVDSVPEGADLTYFVPASLADTAAMPDSAHPRRPAKIVVLGASGDTVRVLEGERKPGLNRVWWDLRYTRPTVPKLRTPPPGKPFVRTGPDGTRPLVSWDLDLSLHGPLVPPGGYQVRLTVGDSAASAATLTQPLTVLKDPNTAASDSDVAAQTRLALAIRAAQDSAARMINRLEWVRKQLADLSGQLRGDTALAGDSSAKRLAGLADSLDRHASAVEGALFDVHLTGAREDAFRSPMQLYGRLAALQSDVSESGADFAPTTQQQAVYELLTRRLGDASARFAALMEPELRAFGAELRKAPLKDVISAIDYPSPARPGP